METAKKRKKGGAEYARERNKKELKEISSKCRRIGDFFVGASTSKQPPIVAESAEITTALISESEETENTGLDSAFSESEKRRISNFFSRPDKIHIKEFFDYHPKQPETNHFDSQKVYHSTDGSGERLQRMWLSYCSENERLFCSMCIAFTSSAPNFLSKFVTGFNNWKYVHQRIKEHESSKIHKDCVDSYMRCQKNETIGDLCVQRSTYAQNVTFRNREVLRRIT